MADLFQSSEQFEEVRGAQERRWALPAVRNAGNLAPLHADHIVPREARNKRANTVTTHDGQVVDVDDDKNLQVLCVTCNTAKRASDTTDFRPSAQRLAEVIRAVRRLAAELGIEATELEELAVRSGAHDE